ncbi:hypothetical protein [Methylobacterium oryzisoli]|uniref:hypothetical protein n=1 Tax=Methylobacterium oryzisoli TaxID=3385502 RepID=UPI00389238CF
MLNASEKNSLERIKHYPSDTEGKCCQQQKAVTAIVAPFPAQKADDEDYSAGHSRENPDYLHPARPFRGVRARHGSSEAGDPASPSGGQADSRSGRRMEIWAWPPGQAAAALADAVVMRALTAVE